MLKKSNVGILFSVTGALLGTVVMLLLFVMIFEVQVDAEIVRGAPIEAQIVSFILPALTNLSMVGGALWVVSAYGYATGKEWSFPVSITASVLCILAGFFPILPYVSSDLGFPPTSLIFVVNLLFFILLQISVRPTERRALFVSVLAGTAYILAFINGVASTHYIIATGGAFFIALQPLNFAASVSWGVAAIATVMDKKWSSPLIIGAATTSVMGGIPLALLTQMEMNRLSLFWPSPLMALLTLAAAFLVKQKVIDNRT